MSISSIRQTIEQSQLQHLNKLLSFVSQQNNFYQAKLRNVNLPLGSLAELKHLPFTTKAELVGDQQSYPPFGRNHSYTEEHYIRYHQTSGTTGRPLRLLDTKESWEWWSDCWCEVFRSAGVTIQDRVFFAFHFGPFIGFWAAVDAAKKLGALVIPGGGQGSVERLQSIFNNRATVLLCTPSYALHLAEVAAKEGLHLKDSPIRVTIHAGEPGGSIPAVRSQIEDIWGAKCFDHAGMTEMGAYGYSCESQSGLHVNEGQFIAEVINPDNGNPAAEGEKGELVLTNLGRFGYPVIRYRTHDMVIKVTTPCSCGNPYILFPGGIIGRTDDMMVVRGINIFPSSIEAIVREFREIQEFRIVLYTVSGMDQVKVEIELQEGFGLSESQQSLEAVATRMRERLGLRIEIELKEPHSLPRFEMKAKRTMDTRTRTA